MTDQPQCQRIDPEQIPERERRKFPGQIHGVYIIVRPDRLNRVSEGFAWHFRRSKDARIVSADILDKAGIGLIVIEWIEYEVDPLFLMTLEEEEDKYIDYKLYQRKLEQNNESKE